MQRYFILYMWRIHLLLRSAILVRTSSLKGFFVKCEIYEDCGYMTASSRLLFPVAEVCVRSLRVLAVRKGKIVNK